MANKTDPDEPINPLYWDERNQPEFLIDKQGLTKREYFAGIALQGILASNKYATTASIVINSVEFADALIKQLNLTNNEESS